jgi:hypothetical protein
MGHAQSSRGYLVIKAIVQVDEGIELVYIE